MRADDIKVGMWVRCRDGLVFRAFAKSDVVVNAWNVWDLHGNKWVMTADTLQPWTPLVGEWVRVVSQDGALAFPVGYVTTVEKFTAYAVDRFSIVGDCRKFSDEGGPWATVANVEPCLPPAPPTTYLRADWVEVPADRFEDANASFEASMRRAAAMPATPFSPNTHSLWAGALGANGTCPKCGGLAYLGLQEAKCLAPRCERVEPEPEVRELWVGFRHEKRPGERGIRDALLAPMGPEYERWWQATGRGVTKNHPIREEAIRLWREAVARG